MGISVPRSPELIRNEKSMTIVGYSECYSIYYKVTLLCVILMPFYTIPSHNRSSPPIGLPSWTLGLLSGFSVLVSGLLVRYPI